MPFLWKHGCYRWCCPSAKPQMKSNKETLKHRTKSINFFFFRKHAFHSFYLDQKWICLLGGRKIDKRYTNIFMLLVIRAKNFLVMVWIKMLFCYYLQQNWYIKMVGENKHIKEIILTYNLYVISPEILMEWCQSNRTYLYIFIFPFIKKNNRRYILFASRWNVGEFCDKLS